jgi:hypothetical protein
VSHVSQMMRCPQKWTWLAAFVLLAIAPGGAFATTLQDVPKKGETRKQLRESLRVKHKYFAIVVPKHWTYQASDRKSGWIKMSPSADLSHAPVKLSLKMRRFEERPLEDFKARFDKDPGKKTQFVQWQNQRWLLVEEASGGRKKWVAYAVSHHIGFKVQASVPLDQLDQVRPELFNAMESVALFPNGIPRGLASLDEAH